MNRYTQISPSAYNPMTMQEIMTTPLAMREQHNKTQAAIEAQTAELDKIRALPVHTEEAMARKNELIKSIDALSSDLANKGFSNDMSGNLIKLNRQIKDEFSPTGRIGKIGTAYDTYFKEMENFRKSNEDKKWSQDEFNRHWNEHTGAYQGYDPKGDVINIGSLTAPDKVLISDRWKELSSIMGDSKLAGEVITGNAYPKPGPNGSLYIVDTKTDKKVAYNNPQVVAALQQVYSELNDPTSSLSKSRVYSGQSPERAIAEAANIGRSKIDVDTKLENLQGLNIHGYKNTDDLAKEKEDRAITTVNTEEAASDTEGTIGQAYTITNKLSDKINTRGWNSLSDDEKEDYIDAKGAIDNFNAINKKDIKSYGHIMKGNKPIYSHYAEQLGLPANRTLSFNDAEQTYNKAKKDFLKKFTPGTIEYEMAEQTIKNGPKNTLADYGNLSTKIAKSGKHPDLLVGDIVSKYNNSVKKKADIYYNYRNDLYKHGNKYTQYYKPLTAGDDTSTGKRFKEIDKALTQTMKTAGSANSLGSITQVTDSKGNIVDLRKGDQKKHITQNRQDINKVMQTSENIEFIDLTDNDRGFPAIRLKVHPGKDNEAYANLKGTGYIDDDEVGEGKPFTVTLRMDDFTNIKSGSTTGYGTRALLNQVLELMMERGDEKGIAVAQSALNRIQANK